MWQFFQSSEGALARPHLVHAHLVHLVHPRTLCTLCTLLRKDRPHQRDTQRHAPETEIVGPAQINVIGA